MTVFLIILFILLSMFRVAAGFYVEQIPFFAALLTPLTWVLVGVGVVMALFIAAKLYREFKGK